MKKRIVRRNGYEVKIGQIGITINNVVIPKVTDEFIDNNLQYFDIEVIVKELKHYTDKLDSFSHWSIIKEQETKLYWLKILQLIAYDLNKSEEKTEKQYFITKPQGWRYEQKDDILHHVSVRYNLVYFNSRALAKQAKEILGDKIKYVV